jgi:hypothetical protein
MYRITVTFPKKSLPFSSLTPWGHMSIDYYDPGGTKFPKILYSPSNDTDAF